MVEPVSELVIREVTKGVWTFSRPFARFGVWPIGGRSTAIQLRDGGTWVLASTPLDAETKSKIDQLGEVKYIVSADDVHTLYLGEFKSAYPQAKLCVTPGAAEKLKPKNIVIDALFGPRDAKFGFEDEIEHCYFTGFKNKDVAFLHKDSKSLIEADLLMNLPANEQYSKSSVSKSVLGFSGPGPFSWAHQKFTAGLSVDKEAMQRDAKTVNGWDFERIIPCHGDIIESRAKEAWQNVFQHFL